MAPKYGLANVCVIKTYIQTDRKTDRQTDTQADRKVRIEGPKN